jgi:hypothetical protein
VVRRIETITSAPVTAPANAEFQAHIVAMLGGDQAHQLLWAGRFTDFD